MKLTRVGHDDRYAVEQLCITLFGVGAEGTALSQLHRGPHWLTAVTILERNGKKTRGVRRLKTGEETVQLRRRILQQSLYMAALPHLDTVPAWGALAGVRPTKLSTKHLLEGGTPASANILRDIRISVVQHSSRSLRSLILP